MTMHRRHVLLRETLARPLTPAAATAAGFILPAEHRIAGRPVYATTGWTEALESAGEPAWAQAAVLLTTRAMQQRQAADRLLRLRVRWRVGAAVIPTVVAVGGSLILLMLDGE